MMQPEAVDTAVNLPISAYVEPIRSVLFIDDQFPSYANPDSGNEGDRARALWTACSERGWLCDVDNRSDWSSEAQQKRLVSSDLLVLDYQLNGNDPTPALKLIEKLASSPSPDVVVVYTSDSALNNVLLSLAAFARGVDESLINLELEDKIADMEGKIQWSVEAITSYLEDRGQWKSEFKQACRAEGIDTDFDAMSGSALLGRWIRSKMDAPLSENPRRIEAISCDEDGRWFQCGNLFVTVVGKPESEDMSREAEALFEGLEASIRAWDPSWLACLIARSREEMNEGAFRDDLVLPDHHLQTGLLEYMISAEDSEERSRRARHIAADLLQRRFDAAANRMAEDFLKKIDENEQREPAHKKVQAFVHTNAFLCAKRHDRHHLRVGTVFRAEDCSHYWVCVTPACDMVPRVRKESMDPWGASLGDARAMTAIRLDVGVANSTALRNAQKGRYIFFEDYSESLPRPKIAAVFNVDTDEPNPKIEQMFAKNLGRKSETGGVLVLRVIREDDEMSLREVPCVVVCQLRAPYAERLTHIVGGHLSRIGVDFLSIGAQEDG